MEEINGWAALETDDTAEAVIRLKRAVSVLPVDSVWWRTSTWRLGSAMARTGKEGEALQWYIRSYKSSGPNTIGYGVIEALYRSVNGNLDGLEARIGVNPAVSIPADAVARNVQPLSTPEARAEPTAERVIPQPRPVVIPASVPVATPAVTPEPTPAAALEEVKTPSPEPTPAAALEEVKPSPSPELPIPIPSVTPEEVTRTPTPEVVLEPTPEATPAVVPSVTPGAASAEPTPTPAGVHPTPLPDASPRPTPDPTFVAATELKAEPTPLLNSEEKKAIVLPSPSNLRTEAKAIDATKELFPAVVITIPQPDAPKSDSRENAPKTEALPDARSEDEPKSENPRVVVKQLPQNPPVTGSGRRFSEFKATTRREGLEPCKFIVSEENLTIRKGGGGLAVVVGLENDAELDGLTAISTSPGDVSVRREIIAGVKSRALFVVSSISPKTGGFQVKFELPCGERNIVVRVRQE